MANNIQQLAEAFVNFPHSITDVFGELTLELDSTAHWHSVAKQLRDIKQFSFEMLIDLCGVDYLHYGIAQWETTTATAHGFERGFDNSAMARAHLNKKRFAVVIHLLSITHNHRLRLKVKLDETNPTIPSVIDIWPAANWFEREAYDLFGIMFTGHPDLRRILTDYGFIGHPFRKDFPLSGEVEVRYDASCQKVINTPVSITPRILEPKVIRHDPHMEAKT